MNIASFRNSMRVLAATSSIVLTVGAAAAFASDTVGTNRLTGQNSENINRTQVRHTETIMVRRTAEVRTPVDVRFNSGDQTVHNNTTVSGVSNGNVHVMGAIENDVNVGSSLGGTVTSSSSSDSFDGLNDRTGQNSRNVNDTDIKRELTVDSRSTAELTNRIDANLKSGNNSVRNNTTVGHVSGGDITFDFDVANTANSGNTNWSTLLNHESDSDFVGTNTLTGQSSENINRTNVRETTDISDIRTATINNTFDVYGNSGGNDIHSNTSVGNVSSGDITVLLTVSNTAN